MRKKSFWYFSSYYRSLFIFIPMNILGAVLCLVNLTKDIDDYQMVEGIIVKSYLEWNKAPFIIELENEPEQWYKVYPNTYYPILQEKAKPGKKAFIWYDKDDNIIKQLIVEGDILRPYKKGIGLWLTLFLVSTLLVAVNVIYIILNPSHAKGKSKDD